MADLLAREDARDQQGMGGLSVDEMIDAAPSYDDRPAPDPFAHLPAGMG